MLPAFWRRSLTKGWNAAQVRLVSYCPKHCTAHPELSGVQRIKDGEAAEDRGDEGTGLWNAQPFKQPPAVPLPDCPAGCIRAQPIVVRPLPFLRACQYFPCRVLV